MNKNTIKHYKFTLIELLVVIAIIAMTLNRSIIVKYECFIPVGWNEFLLLAFFIFTSLSFCFWYFFCDTKISFAINI